jgi:hypothetical protein
MSGVPGIVSRAGRRAVPGIVGVATMLAAGALGAGSASAYTIPDFANCTIFGPLPSSQVSGPGNTISLQLGKPAQP